MSDLRLGKNGSVNTGNLQGGIKKDEKIKKDKNLEAIFNSVDQNKDGVLDADEIKKFKEDIIGAAGNEKLSNREAGKYLKEQNLKHLDKKELFKFIEVLSQSSENIKDSNYTVDNNGKKTIQIQYQDGSVETIKPNGTREIATQGENGETIVKTYKRDAKNPTSITTTTPDGVTETQNYDDNGILTNVVVVNDEGTKTTTKFNEDGKVTEATTVYDGGHPVEVTTFDENGEPDSLTVTDGTTVEEYYYDENGEPVLDVRKENVGIPAKEKITEFEYNEDGSVTENVRTASGESVINRKEDGSYTETVKSGNTTTETTFNSNNKRLSQTKTVDGKTYHVKYDGEGNTLVTVQNGESIEMLAKKFGCTVEEIINANKDDGKVKGGKNPYFLVGDEIKIPRELDADDKALQGRKSREEAIEGYEEFLETKRQEEARRAEEEEQAREAEETRKREEENRVRDEQVKEKRANAQKEGRAIASDLYDDIDYNFGTRSTFEKNLARVNKDNIVEVIQAYTEKSPDESLMEAIFDEAGRGVKANKEAVTYLFEQLKARALEDGIDIQEAQKAFDKAIKLPHGYANNEDFDVIFNTLIAKINGKSSLTSAEKTEIKNTDKTVLQKETTEILDNAVVDAEESLKKQLDEDGWAADFWEGLKWLGGSENLDEHVRADIEKVKAQTAQLKACKTPEEFEAKFKELYGVDYDPELVKAYQKRQEQLVGAMATHQVETTFNEKMEDALNNRINDIEEFNELVDTFAEFAGQGDKDAVRAELEKAYIEAGLSPTSPWNEKQKVFRQIVKTYSEQLHKNTMEATEGKGFEAFNDEVEHSFKAAFGMKNDVLKRVADYNASQQAGGMIVKGIVKGAAAIGLALIPGVGLIAAAVGTAAISAGVDVSDRLSSEKGLTEDQVVEYLKNAAIDGATVYIGGKVAKSLLNAKAFVQAGGNFVSDVATSAIAEKLQTGHITINGVVFQCMFSAAGNLVALKNLGKAQVGPDGKPIPPKPDTDPTPNPKPDNNPTPVGPDGKPIPPKPDTDPTPNPKPDNNPTPVGPDGKPINPTPEVNPTPDVNPTPNNGKSVKPKPTPTPAQRLSDPSEMKKFLLEHNVPMDYAQRLSDLLKGSPKRFNKIVNSGLFDLIKDGRISPDVLKKIGKKRFLSKKFLQDVKRMHSENSIVNTAPKNAHPSQIAKYADNGDVVEFNGKLYVNNNGKPIEIQLSRKRFDELFPPASRMDISQHGLGDCWLVSSMDNLMDLPAGRVALYSMLKEHGDDILVQFPNSAKAVRFPQGKVLDAGGKQITGATGMKMIEQAYAVHRNNLYSSTNTITDIANFTDVNFLMKQLESGTCGEAFRSILGNKADYHYSTGPSLSSEAEKRRLIKEFAGDEDVIINLGTYSQDNKPVETLISDEYDLFSGHGYSIKGYDEASGMVYISNPWQASTIIEIPIDELMKYTNTVWVAKIKPEGSVYAGAVGSPSVASSSPSAPNTVRNSADTAVGSSGYKPKTSNVDIDDSLELIDEYTTYGFDYYTSPSTINEVNDTIEDLLAKIRNQEIDNPQEVLNKIEKLQAKLVADGQDWKLDIDRYTINSFREDMGFDVNYFDKSLQKDINRMSRFKTPEMQAQTEAFKDVFNTLGKRISSGEVPSKELLDEVISQRLKGTDIDVDDFTALIKKSMRDSDTWSGTDFRRSIDDIRPSQKEDLVKKYRDNFGLREKPQTAPDRMGLNGTKGTFFTQDEVNYVRSTFVKYSEDMQDSILEVLDNIGKKIQQGEMPSYDIVRSSVREIASSKGINASQLDSNVMQCIDKLEEWKPISKYLNMRSTRITDSIDPATVDVNTKVFKKTKGLDAEAPASTPTSVHEFDGIKGKHLSSSEIEAIAKGTGMRNAQMKVNIIDAIEEEIKHGGIPSQDMIERIVKKELFNKLDSTTDPDQLVGEIKDLLRNKDAFPDWAGISTFFSKRDAASQSILKTYPEFITEFLKKRELIG